MHTPSVLFLATPLAPTSNCLLLLSPPNPSTRQAFINVPSTTTEGVTLTLTIQQSEPLVNILGPAAYSCLLGQGADRASCNAVANLCALQMYSP